MSLMDINEDISAEILENLGYTRCIDGDVKFLKMIMPCDRPPHTSVPYVLAVVDKSTNKEAADFGRWRMRSLPYCYVGENSNSNDYEYINNQAELIAFEQYLKIKLGDVRIRR